MRGSITQRYKGSWSLILDLGYRRDPATGKLKRQQKWVTFRGTKADAEKKLNELIHAQNKGAFVEPNKRTLGEWLTEWWAKVIRATKTPRTADTYEGVINNHLVPKLGSLRLQGVKSIDLEQYYAEHRPALSEATLEQHHMIISGALKAAVREGLLSLNVATLVNGKPKAQRDHAEEVGHHCWNGAEARAFLDAAKAAGDQAAAFYALALETGIRKSELGGLKWTDVDLAKGQMTIQRQLVTLSRHNRAALGVKVGWTFGLPKGKKPRTVRLNADTIALLRRHKVHQAELKLQSGGRYHDHGLLFAKEWVDVRKTRDTLGDPLGLNNIGQREFARLIKAAGVRTIKFHGMRHTAATLALQEGNTAKVVQERLGHKKITTTLDIYAHVLPAMDQEAADSVGSVIHGTAKR